MKIIHFLYIIIFVTIVSCDVPFMSGSGEISFNPGIEKGNNPVHPTYTLNFTSNDYLYNYNLTQNANISYNNVILDPILSCHVTPSLPANLSMNPSDCTISGLSVIISTKTNYHLIITTEHNTFEGNFNYGVYVEACDPSSTTLTGTLKGYGTNIYPYIICNSGQLDEYLTTYGGSGYAILQNDITITSPTSVGDLNNANFDGRGYTITAYINPSKVNNGSFDHYGFFSKINYSTVKRLTLKGEISGRDFVGSLAGEITTSEISDIHIHKSLIINGNYTGGLIGYNTTGSVSEFKDIVSFPVVNNTSTYFYPLFANMENLNNQIINRYYFGSSSIVAGSLNPNIGNIITTSEYADSLNFLVGLNTDNWNISSGNEPSLKTHKEKIYE